MAPRQGSRDLTLAAVGKLRPYYREAADDYVRRLKHHVKLHEVEIREASRAPSILAQLAEEGKRLGPKITPGSNLVALTRLGTGWTSRDLAGQLERWLQLSRPVTLLLGGSNGLDRSLIARADARWSLGPLTLPHELARVVVLEQLYRAFTILRGEPYHKGL
ncbi:MAG: 23S rRNA (pseudouridine(1915)-N(3))-methyltransferase RlmH [Gemmatimonadales bacterium]